MDIPTRGLDTFSRARRHRTQVPSANGFKAPNTGIRPNAQKTSQGESCSQAATVRIHSKTFKEKEVMEKEEQRARNCLAQNDLTNFWQLWVQHQGYLYIRCLQWMGGNHADAQDALSSSMLKALDGISNCTREIVNAKGWLTRVTHNHCVDMQRSRQRLPITLPNLEEIPFSYGEIGLHFVETPEDSLFTKEMFAHIGRIFDDLPPRLREPTRLRFFGEMSYQDISEHLTISNENVRKRIQQARTIVRERLAKHL